MPAIFTHHNTYCSYADLIMPQFFFAVGFAYRLAFLRRLQKGEGRWPAYRHAIGRCVGLFVIGFCIYHLDGGYSKWEELRQLGFWGFLTTAFKTGIWQTLVHIAATSLWILPVIAARPVARVAFLVGTGLLHLALSHLFYYQWAMTEGAIDGGPLGFMSWAIPTLVGSLTYDLMASDEARKTLKPLLTWSVVLMVLGYGISCLNAVHHTLAGTAEAHGLKAWLVEPPFVAPSRPVDIWTMSQKAGSISYLTFSAGASLLIYVLFVRLAARKPCARRSDIGSFQVGLLRTLGGNALAAYIISSWLEEAIHPFVPGNAPLWYVMSAFALFLGLTWLSVRYLEKNNLYLRL